MQYADLLRTFQHDMASPLDEQRVLQHIATMLQLWSALENEINEEMAELLPLLNAAQREELFESIEDKNEDFYDEYVDLDDDERIDQYIDTSIDNFENWLGYLTNSQVGRWRTEVLLEGLVKDLNFKLGFGEGTPQPIL